jgi:hypothetical protein
VHQMWQRMHAHQAAEAVAAAGVTASVAWHAGAKHVSCVMVNAGLYRVV